MAGKGWIKLHRKIRDNSIFNDHQLLRLWLICLTEATHKERDQIIGKQTVHLMPGEFVTGRFEIRDLYNFGLKPKEKVLGEKTVFRWLQTLETTGFLTIKSTNKFSVVSIDNWGFYQGEEVKEGQQTDQQKTNKRPSNDHQMTTNKNVKNDKNEKEIDTTDNFTRVERAYATIHKTLGLKPIDWPIVNQLLEKGVTADLIIEVMEEKHAKKIQEGGTVNGFSFYTNAINERFNQGQRNEGRLDFLNDL
ncbi:hypothetical protein ABER23_08010 [Paenibacillus lautus]|uniref:hypothetical protein n=1 Tax=Paenibacillus lautus TaxID=1401 RepID=UPI003D2C75A6